ncbi:hypothetical protein K438DRAFT_2087070 [Mycena galopus ATCC 62051]|nr:hypothetical protein K438DRAFT_2087070 [Mycena galopus ATCC 62051]
MSSSLCRAGSAKRRPQAIHLAGHTATLGLFLVSNDAPNGLELSSVQELLVVGCNRTQSLRNEIAELTLATERSLRDLKETKQKIRRRCTPCAGCRRRSSARYSRGPGERCIAKQTVAPWYLGHICRRGRATALVYTLFWSPIALLPFRKARQGASLMIETQLSRLGNALLHVTFDGRNGDPIQSCSSNSMSAISPSERGSFACGSFVQSPAEREGPTALAAHAGIFTSAVVSTIGKIFSIAPHLRRVFLTGAKDSEAFSLSHIPWVEVYHYCGSYANCEAALQSLESAPNMVEYDMTITDSRWPSSDHCPHVVLPKLLWASIHNPRNYFKFVTVPSPQELWVSVVEDCSDPPGLVSILRANLTLTTLYVMFAGGITQARVILDPLKLTGGPLDIRLGLTHVAAGGPNAFGT